MLPPLNPLPPRKEKYGFQVTQICKCVTSVSYYLTFIKIAGVGATLVARQSVDRSVEP